MYCLLPFLAFVHRDFRAQPRVDSPVDCVQGFVAALNRGDVKGACALVAGGQFTYPAQTLERVLQTVSKKMHANFQIVDVREIGDASEESSGEATVPLTVAFAGQEPVQETLHLKIARDRWLIVPSVDLSDRTTIRPVGAFTAAAAQPIAMLAILLPIMYRSAGKQPEEGKDMRGGVSLVLMYAATHKDTWPKSFTDLKDGFKTLSSSPGVPAELGQLVDRTITTANENNWVINQDLAGKSQSELTDPLHTVLAYEAGSDGLNYRFEGKALVALASGVTQLVTPAQAAKLRWTH
jgi:hypothetical protein